MVSITKSLNKYLKRKGENKSQPPKQMFNRFTKGVQSSLRKSKIDSTYEMFDLLDNNMENKLAKNSSKKLDVHLGVIPEITNEQ
mmetsp:Transcript_24918/g.28609  ORF Transcript_24918/g.28609 Transcript_24918/m.28609 type:complete len:84 (-) Transcript_24918:9-260(-)